MVNLLHGMQAAAMDAYNRIRGEVLAKTSDSPYVEEIVHSDDDDDDDVQVVEPPTDTGPSQLRPTTANDFDNHQSRFKPPARNSIVGTSLEQVSSGLAVSSTKRPSASTLPSAGTVACTHAMLCERYVGATKLFFHHTRGELEIQFLAKTLVATINKYCKPMDDPKRLYLPFNEIRSIGHSEDETLKMILFVVNRSSKVVTLQASGLNDPPCVPECAFAFDDDIELAKMQSLLAIHLKQLPNTALPLGVMDKYRRIVDRRFKKASKYFTDVDDNNAFHAMTTRRAEKRKLSGPSSLFEPVAAAGPTFASSRAKLRESMAIQAQGAPSSAAKDDATVVVDSPPRKPRYTDEEKAARQEAKDRVVVHYPLQQVKNRITLTEGDIDRLGEGEFLNDNLIDFFFKYCHIQLDEWQKEHMYFFSTHFYTTLVQQQQQDGERVVDPFDKIRRWTKSISIFTQRFLFVPINDNCHWSLAVICNPGFLAQPPIVEHGGGDAPCILFFDSLRCHNKAKIVATLQAYLEKEFSSRYPDSGYVFDATNATLVEPEVPRQTNSCDCGVFVLLYALELIKRYPGGVTKEDIEMQCRSELHEVMFCHQNIVEFRDYLQTLLGVLSVWQTADIFDTKENLDHAGMGLFSNSFTS